MAQIAIAEDFTRFPGGRHRELGKFSGEEFRDDHLIPHLRTKEHVRVLLDGTAGYGSSFLEEAFGGLLRFGFTLDELKEKLEPVAEDPSFKTYVQEIWEYINDEAMRQKGQ